MKRVLGTLLVLAFAGVAAAWGGETQPLARAPEIQRTLDLRARYRIPVPASEPAIYVDSIAVHHVREEQSVVASRDADGIWHISVVIEEGSGLLKVEPHLASNQSRTLSAAESRHLDELLQQTALYRERSDLSQPPAIGGVIHTMEIDTAAGHGVIRWTGRLEGKAGAVADLVIGPG